MDAEDPRIAPTRRAFEEARFDERAPDEAGFAARFESEFKPRLLEGIARNFAVADARRKRRKMFLVLAPALVISAFVLPAALHVRGEVVSELFVYAAIGIGVLSWRWSFMRRPDDEDPNHAAVIQAVLEAFGCRAVRGGPPKDIDPKKAPIRPAFSSSYVLPDHIVGRFDGRIAFTALRVKFMMKEGKHTRTTFKGWYLRVELPFAFRGTTVIRDLMGRYGLTGGDGLVPGDLESPEFAERFAVLSDDQVEARMILTPDVMGHLIPEADRLRREQLHAIGGVGCLMLGFRGSHAHIWIPSRATALSDWQPLHPQKLIEDIHEAFAELAEIRAFLRDIDVIAESEGFRAEAARNARTP